GLWYLLASTLAFCIALVTSFVLQKFWTFSDDPNKNILGQFSRFAIVSVCNLAINVTLMYISVDVLTMQYLAAQFIVTGLIAFFSFFIYRDLVFRRER
ncbi:MAG: GtrA family protein, partial [bacterium]|nr:GtrA family protein [bacterium]